MIFGLCGGLGEYFSVDPTLVRILFVLLAMPGGFGVLAYIVMSVIVPLEPGEKVNPEEEVKQFARKAKKGVREMAEEMKEEKRRGGFRLVFGAVLIAAGFFLLFGQLFPFYHMGAFFWPLLIILFGIYLAVKDK